MPRLPTLKIIEIFASLQGEGLRQGEPTVFIRFSGCNLKCSFCDTRYAWNGGRELTPFQALREIHKIRNRYPADWVCLTGGEPLLQDVSGLVKDLRQEGLKIQVETNATLYRPLTVDWYTVSPKPPRYSFRPEYRKRAKEVKLVVTRVLKLRDGRTPAQRISPPDPASPPAGIQCPLERGKEPEDARPGSEGGFEKHPLLGPASQIVRLALGYFCDFQGFSQAGLFAFPEDLSR